MQQDLLTQWLDTTELQCHTIERLSKRRRIDYTGEEEGTSDLQWPSLPPRANSDDYRQASRSTTLPARKQVHDAEVYSPSRLTAHRHWQSRRRESARHPKQKDPGLYDRYTVDPSDSRLSRSKSDSWLISYKGCEVSAIVQADYMPQSPKPSPPGSLASIGSAMEPPPSVRGAYSDSKRSTGSKQTRIDATNTNYRKGVLASNRVTIESATTPLPVNVAAAVNQFVLEQGSSAMDHTTATVYRDSIIRLGEYAEADLTQGFMRLDILPFREGDPTLKLVQQIPFTNAMLPQAIIPYGYPGPFQSICEPKPDVAYGYKFEAFSRYQNLTQNSTLNGTDLSRFSRLAKELYWPFFVVEFKAPAVGGNIYAAENQCAGGGSASLLACQTLHSIASKANNDYADPTDTVAYSAAIDGATARLFVHWYDAENEEYRLERFYNYDLNRPEDIQKLHLHTNNIVDWGVGARLEKIKAALDVIFEEQMRMIQPTTKELVEPLSPPIS